MYIKVENTIVKIDKRQWHNIDCYQVVPEADIIKKGFTPNIDSYSAFFDNGKLQSTELEELILKKEITDVFVCGIAYDVCVGESRMHDLIHEKNISVLFVCTI